MRIARDGTWFYLGTPIGREALVRLFASVLRKDGERYFLVTPVEKVGITVDDAPFVAVDFRRAGDSLVFADLEALIDRKSFYRLVEIGEVRPVDGVDWFGLASGGAFFPVIPAAELDA